MNALLCTSLEIVYCFCEFVNEVNEPVGDIKHVPYDCLVLSRWEQFLTPILILVLWAVDFGF